MTITLQVDSALVPDVVAALATRAKYYEKLPLESGAFPEITTADKAEWETRAEQLWGLIRQFDGQVQLIP